METVFLDILSSAIFFQSMSDGYMSRQRDMHVTMYDARLASLKAFFVLE